ncbi:hypothetical protein ABH940_006128 [Streptacidiphilus sp. BW17]|uniref:hypothetical protein n=1 Tax=Streptacidiphilus sp. BW17 TaxID=3156274 RepID=UPI003517048E
MDFQSLHRAVRAVAVLVAGAASLTACSAGAPSANASSTPALTVAQPTPSHVATIPTVSGLSLPIEPYLLTQATNTEMLRASGVLIQQCMTRYGFSYTPPNFAANDPASDVANMPRRYGVTDMAMAQKYGYHNPATMGSPSTGAPAPQPMSESEQLVFLGNTPGGGFEHASQVYQGQQIPQGGCSGDAQRKLGTGMNQRLAENIDDTSYNQSLANPVLLAAFTKWSGCMKQSGYSVSTPAQAPGFRLKPSPTTAEIQMAETDVTCKKQANVIGVWFAVESAIQNKLIAQNEEALTELKQSEQETLKKAAQVLQGS